MRAFRDFAPKEFREHVRGLFFKPVRPKRESVKKAPKPFTWRVNQKGTLCLRVNREPKWMTREEVEAIAKEAKLPLATVWNKAFGKKSKIKLGEPDATQT